MPSVSAAKFPKSAECKSVCSLISHNSIDLEPDLVCSQQFMAAKDEVSFDPSMCNEMTLSEFDEETDCSSSSSSSTSYYSLSEFDEETDCSSSSTSYYSLSNLNDSTDDDSSDESRDGPARADFLLFLRMRDEFSPSTYRKGVDASSESKEDLSPEFDLTTFEEDEDEESYVRFRSRERKEVMLHDYGAEYSLTTEHGRLILDQRLLMVRWIMEHSKAMDLETETLFLAVDLMDRFLSRGYFTSVRNLQLLGISCITIATLIVENQHYNEIRQTSFRVGDNVYSRIEVLAMERMVRDVLNFQLFHPTTLHFLGFYLKAARADAKVEQIVRCSAVSSLVDLERLSFSPSTVAAALVILALLATNQESSWHTVVETHVRTTDDDDLSECIESLDWWLIKLCSSTFQLTMDFCLLYFSFIPLQVL